MKSFIRFAVLTLALISAGQASAVFAADAWEIVTPTGTSGYSFTSISTMDNYVYLGTNHGVYRSTNRGTAWSQINSGLANQSVRAIAIGTIFDGSAYAITSNSPVFAATAGGVFKSTIGNTTWSSANVGLTDTNIKDIQFDQFLATQGIDTTVYVATPAGVFRSDDAGDNWLLVDTGMTGQSVTKIMTDFVTGNIYAVTSANEVYVSPMFSASGADESWTLAYSGSAIRDISLLNPLGAISWLAADGGILKSDENGINWFTVNSGNTSGRVNVIMSDYLDMNVTYAGSQTGGVYRTINEALGAPAWSQISTSLSDTAISDIATNPATSLVVYAAGANGVYRLELSDAYADISTTPVVATDTTLPTVSISAPANNATVSGNTTISATAGDNVAVVGVQFKLDGANLVAEDTSSPYSFSWNTASTSNGSHTLTAVARDAAGNTQTATTVTVDVNNVVVVPDITLPTVSAFTVPATATSLTVAGISITASDNIAVTGYLITESSAKPAAGSGNWTVSAPTSYTFASAGAKTVYAWAKDAAGNVSNAFTARNVTITLPDTTLPTLTAFTMPTTATSTIVPVNTLTASDNVAVTGYLITESSTKPTSGAAGWSSIKPTTFTFTGTGARTAYAWAKDAAGNVSNVYTVRNVTITLPDTTIPTVSISTPTNNSTVSGNTNVSATASDNVGVAGVQFKLDGANLGAEDTTAPYSFSWNTASTSNGSHTLTAVARDAAGNTQTATTVSVTVNNVVVVPDTTAPTVTAFVMPANPSALNVSVSTFSASDAVGVTGYLINESATKPVAGVGSWTASAPTSYTFATAGAKTVYAWAKDAAGNVSNSLSQSLTITLPDTTIPTVSISTPTNNSTVSGNTTVSATASDNVGVAGVQFKLDGANLGAEDTSSPYSTVWNTASNTNGSYTLTAVARDASGNTATASTININVNNVVVVPDTTAPTAPTNFSVTPVASNQINLSWTASTDAVGVTGYRVMRKNGSGAFALIATTAMTTYQNTGLSPLSNYTYVIAAYDAVGNVSASSTAVSATTLATPDITNPTVNLTAPANNATVSDTVLVAANASDNVGVIGVQFKLDGANLGAEDTTAPYSFSWNTASTSNGSHTLTAVARDAASNTQTATVVNVVVSNVVITTPTAPANLSASVVSTSQINLTWTASIEAIASYEIYRDNNLVAVVAHPTTSFADTGLAAGATYTYTAKTVTATGVKSVFSNSVSAKTQSKASSGGGGGGGGGSSSTRGCTDPKATNYSAKAKKDNGTCKYAIVKSPTAGSSVVVNNPTSVSGYTFTVVMGLGSKGNDVMELQKVLVSLGYLSETPTGYYGVMTEQAVKKFQIAKGLDAVGSVGPQTRTALNQITAKGSGVKTNDQIIQEKITQLLLLVQELTKKLLILKAAEGR